MRRIFKWQMKLMWNLVGPVRRPLVRVFETWLDPYVVLTAHAATEEANNAFDFATAEMARLQQQVQQMREAVETDRIEVLVVVS
jgi:hypothetical protein